MYQIRKADIATYNEFIDATIPKVNIDILPASNLAKRSMKCIKKFQEFLLTNKDSENDLIDVPDELMGSAIHTIGFMAEKRGNRKASDVLKKQYATLENSGHICAQSVSEYREDAERFKDINDKFKNLMGSKEDKVEIYKYITQYIDLLKSKENECIDVIVPEELMIVHIMMVVAKTIAG